MATCRMFLMMSLMFVATVPSTVWSQVENDVPPPAEDADAKNDHYTEFSKKLSNSALVGHFTIDGQKGEPKEERYELKRVTKMPNGDYWLFRARIRYGDHDVTVPLPLQVVWSGSTPVITLDSVTIPGLGTFSARANRRRLRSHV